MSRASFQKTILADATGDGADAVINFASRIHSAGEGIADAEIQRKGLDPVDKPLAAIGFAILLLLCDETLRE